MISAINTKIVYAVPLADVTISWSKNKIIPAIPRVIATLNIMFNTLFSTKSIINPPFERIFELMTNTNVLV